ncbi:MAG TPA: MarR family transcriptional regulator [Actinomycetota bacterium]|jgi:DNA-binding MarR family transcriptional regulator|nr:MarR family transcriptional regulator [Actinomycetota bacterium]
MPPSAPTPAVEVDHELVVRLRLAVGRLARRLRQQAEGEITASQFSALASVDRLGPLTLGKLASVERLRPPTVTRIAAALEEAGLVVRRPDPDDRRVARVESTPLGHELLDRTRTRKNAYLAARLTTLAPEELAVLRDATAVLERLLEEEGP